MRLDTLIETLEALKRSVSGVEDSSEVTIVIGDAHVTADLDDVKIESKAEIRYGVAHVTATVVLEGSET